MGTNKITNSELNLTAGTLIEASVEKDIPKTYVSGDFNGDGISDAVVIEKSVSYAINTGCVTTTPQTYAGGKTYFVKLDKRLSTNFVNQSGFLVTTDNSKFFVGDFNDDGKSDIYVFDTGSVKVYSLDDNNQFYLLFQTTINDPNIILDRPILMGDYNGDGKTDFMVPREFNSISWYKYMSTGISFAKEEKAGLDFKQNDPFNTYNYIAIDFNNDGKTDLISEQSFQNTAGTLGSVYIKCNRSKNGSFVPVNGISEAVIPMQAGINIYALPVYLPMNRQTLNNGYTNTFLQLAILNQDKIHFFSDHSDLILDNLLTNVRSGNGVEQAVAYIPLNSNYKNTYHSIYNPGVGTSNYPYVDILINPGLYVVSQIEQKSKDTYKKRWFGYYGAVSNVEGLGFLGFRAVTQTNWHDDNTMIFTDIYKNDIDLRGANIETTTVPYLSYPYPGISPTDFVTKSISAYSNTTENPLQGNKVFKLKTTNIKQFNTLNNTNTEVKDIFYDAYNNVTSSTTVSGEASAPIVKTEKTDISYETPKTNPLYILGRPLTKTQSVTADGHTMAMTEQYTYNSQELLSITEKNAIGTPAITEKNDYDSYGNITQKTIIPPLPLLPRVTKFDYDTTKRFVKTITDNDNLVTSFEYDSNGLLKKETDPYSLSRSYTYDSWFKNLTITDDLLNNVISNVYNRSIEKTIVTTTVSAPGLDTSVTEETFDDLGRKIKSGAKDLNGNFSYVSYLYDIYDRNYKVSEPYIGTSPSEWNEVKFDDYGRNTQSTLFNGRTTSASYPPSSLKSIITDGSKSKTTLQNAAGNATSTDETLGGTISYNYFANGALRKTSYNGVAINMEQDGWGQKTKLIDPSAGTYNYNYNDLGELMTETIDGTGIITSIFRDNSGRSTKKTIVGPTTHIEINYTYEGNLPLTIEYVDLNEPTGTNKTKTTITYDAYKRISSIVEDKTGVSKFTTTYTYDNLNRILTETKLAEIGGRSSSVKTKNVYKNGSLHQIIDFETDKVLWQTNTLNAKGQIKESETGNGIKTTNVYDSSTGYLSSVQYDKTTTPTSNILTLTTSFDKNTDYLSKRINSAFGDYTETFKYDEIGRLVEFTNRLGNLETQTYDVSGKITGNNLGTYSYDATKPYQNTSINLVPEATGYYANREGIFNDSMENSTGWTIYDASISYDKTITAHSGNTSLKINNTTSAAEKVIHSDIWTKIDNQVPTEYTYSAWVKSDGPQSEIFLFMKTENEPGYFTHVDSKVTNVVNEWTEITGTFLVPAYIKKLNIRLDNNGQGTVWFDDVKIRKTSEPVTVLRQLNVDYNAFKSPIQIEETNVDKISFTYNEDNQRSTMYYGGFQNEKLDRPLRKHYSADGTMEVKENRLTNTFEFVTYIGGDGYSAPIVTKSDGINLPNYLYLHRDYQGTILAITNSNGDLIEKRLFDAWGSIIKVQDGAGNTLNGLTVLERGYTGHEHLQSVGLINMNARLYDPIIHRFLQTDNFVQDPTNTQNYNQYGYVLNNPLLYTDPSGDICEGCGGIGIGPGTETGSSVDLAKLGRDTGFTRWGKKNFNFNSWGRTWNKIWGKNGNDEPKPQPNMSKPYNAKTSDGQYYGGDGSGSFMDYFNRFLFETEQINPFTLAWDGVMGNIVGRDRYGNDLSGFDANMKIASAIPISKAAGVITNIGERAIFSEAKAAIKSSLSGGKTFAQYKAARGGTETLDFIITSNASGQRVSQRISTEFSHTFIADRTHKAYGLPNWLVINRLNIWKVNSIQHSLIDSYRFRFLRQGLKSEVGWFGKYNWFTKFPQ
ncbi:MAG: RHS repeat-associated core domain-containing protein [Flavobacterium sp.]